MASRLGYHSDLWERKMVKHILKRFLLNLDDFDYVMAYLFSVIVCDIVMLAVLCHKNPLVGTVICLVAALCCLVTMKMSTDNMDVEHKCLYYVYMLASEILSGAIILHIAWWLLNIPLMVSEYHKENSKRKGKKCGY